MWAGDLATALGQAHRANVIHGDVKPANILVTLDQQVKLGDFGIARFSTQASGSGNLMGTPAYLSPEQILGNLQDRRSDLFSLGIVLYHMSTGKRPFDGDSVEAVCAQIISSAPLPPSHHNPSLPAEFDQVVMRCLSKNPEDRFPTAEAFAASVYPFARNAGAAAVRSEFQGPQTPQCLLVEPARGAKRAVDGRRRSARSRYRGFDCFFPSQACHPQPDRFGGHGRSPCHHYDPGRAAFLNHYCGNQSHPL